jgi:hypothetical protein
LNLQDYSRGALCNERYVAAELDCVANTLLGMEKNALACDFARSDPQRLCEIPVFGHLAVHVPIPPFVLFPAVIKCGQILRRLDL